MDNQIELQMVWAVTLKRRAVVLISRRAMGLEIWSESQYWVPKALNFKTNVIRGIFLVIRKVLFIKRIPPE